MFPQHFGELAPENVIAAIYCKYLLPMLPLLKHFQSSPQLDIKAVEKIAL